jgi:hypothetical protein
LSKRRISALLIALVMSLGVSPAWAETFSVEAVKAAFLYRFASYVEWPADSPVTPFVIAVAGAEDVAKQLDQLLPRMKVHGQRVEVRRVARVAELDGVHILYVGPQLTARSRSLRAAAMKRPILIVTDDPRGLDAGGIINFIEANRNVRFEISLIAADRSRLKIDSALLSVAARVERRPQGAISPVNQEIPR